MHEINQQSVSQEFTKCWQAAEAATESASKLNIKSVSKIDRIN